MNHSGGAEVLWLIGIGPGDLTQMTVAAQTALSSADVVIGYQVYIELVRPLLKADQEVIISPLGREMERARQAVDLAAAGQRVALISSGDIGIYAMASPVFEVLDQPRLEVEVFPGISAVQAAAARLGAPLGHDFCTISLSDLLTPWSVIERRLQAAAWGDFVIAFYNPRSQKRDWQLQHAIEILSSYRQATTPVALIRNVTRPDEQITLTTLAALDPTQVDMFTLVLVGNSQSYIKDNRIITPRGYMTKETHQSPNSTTPPLPRSSAPPPPCPSAPPPGSDVYPLTLIDMACRQAAVIGGGPVGERKVRGLLAAGAIVHLISPEATPHLQSWAESGHIHWTRRPYQSGDLSGAELVFAATNQRAVNAQIAQEAKVLGILCNVADQPAEGDFHVPAVHRQPNLVVAVGTTGQSPTRARQVRDELAGWLEQKH